MGWMRAVGKFMHDTVRQSAILAARQAKFLMNELRKTTEGNIHCATMAVPRARVLDLMKVSDVWSCVRNHL